MCDDYQEIVYPSTRGRRKKENRTVWKKNIRSARINSSAGKTPRVACKHVSSKLCKANELSDEDIQESFDKIYIHVTAEAQNNFIIKFIQPQTPKRRRPRTTDSSNTRHRQRNDYFVRKTDGTSIRVCAAAFQSITQLSSFRIKSIAAYFFMEGTSRPERRGGSRMSVKDNETTDSIIDHIKSLKCRSSHYGRNKSIRGYLPPKLSVRKMYRMWCIIRNTMGAPITSFSKYYKIFNKKFNLGFGSPRTDVCSFCELKKIELKSTTDMVVRYDVSTELKLHKLRANKFYELLRDQNSSGEVKVCFDMQQNQPLPKLSISDVYYMRQLWLYNLTFVIIEDNQSKENSFAYTWTENESGKGSNEVCSALLHFLENSEAKYLQLSPTERPHTLKLFSDSCPGQNKNSSVIFLLLCYVQNSIFQEIQHIFPIRGHSFMPADRVFGRSEKIIRKKEQIVCPRDYYNIFAENSTVLHNGRDWHIKDYKKLANMMLKKKFSFKITEQRSFTYREGKRVVSVRNTYCGVPCSHVILKSNNTDISNALQKAEPAKPINKISVAKMENVKHLLKYAKLTEEANLFYERALKNIGKKVKDDLVEEAVDHDEPFL